jgi:hypothetical protein
MFASFSKLVMQSVAPSGGRSAYGGKHLDLGATPLRLDNCVLTLPVGLAMIFSSSMADHDSFKNVLRSWFLVNPKRRTMN